MHGAIGHNRYQSKIRIEVRLFNSLARFIDQPGWREFINVPVDANIGDLIARYRLPLPEIFLVLRNGRDITPGLYQGGAVNMAQEFEDGDVIAFSGPVPYSPGYGAPVV